MIELIRHLAPQVEVAVADDWMWDTKVYPEEETFITRAVEKRKREFRAGRHTAHKVLAALGKENFCLKVGDHRQPLWPEGIIGSISHTEGYCACAATRKQDIISLGIDVEPLIQVDKASLPLICTRKEQTTIENLQAQTDIPLCKLVFSAKESVHKVYHPLNGHTLDFLDAEISFDLAEQTFQARITNPEKKPRFPIKVLNGNFDFNDNYLFTVILKEKE